MSKRKNWKGTEPVAKTAEQHRRDREYEAMPPEEKKAAHRKQLVGFLNMFQGSEPIMNINGKAQTHSPMTKEEADLHLAIFDGEVEFTPEIRLRLAQYEAMRFPNSKRSQGKMWKAMEDVKESDRPTKVVRYRVKDSEE
jgi:hypothetical protein